MNDLRIVLIIRSDVSGCTLTGCGSFNVSAITGYVKYICSATTFNSVCDLNCAYGYSGSPNDPVCQTNGLWTPASGCTKTSCDPYDVPVGYIKNTNCGVTYQNSYCDLSCDVSQGYTGTAVDPICQTNNQWSAAGGCTSMSYVI